MTDRRRSLLVSFFYPPDPAVGGRRVRSFARHLPEFGWDPVVLTSNRPQFGAAADGEIPVHRARFFSFFEAVHPPDRPGGGGGAASGAPLSSMRDRALTSGLKGALYRGARHLLPMSVSRMPDATLGWVPDAVAEGMRLIRRIAPNVLVSSQGPPSSHIVASILRRRSGIPWVADYRDLWSQNYSDLRTPAFAALERALERRVLRNASAITTISQPLADRLDALLGSTATVVFNGFEPDDYGAHSGAGGSGSDGEPGQDERPAPFRLSYVGSLYPEGQELEPLLLALKRLQNDGIELLDEVGLTIDFVGTSPHLVLPLARQHGVDRWIAVRDPVPYAESLALQQRSTALLYLGWRDVGAGVLVAKLYEYLGADRPILSVGPRGGLDEAILKECGGMLPETDPGIIASTLQGWARDFRDRGSPTSPLNRSAALAYTRQAQTGRLARLLDEVVAARVGFGP